ncbi:hypothetical protein ATCV1_Z791L [Acanthocystis turfacea chlorella virus 1]|uniref:Uncharacterized protein Z791L n=1 Tax=Chlorovirus heliozoae TaxID=322019 RepID=A7KA51_9PHYC|nr:hypothetical protein ATCV1_Z791L [Acanthocystis turfacea chlorella virus 1]ABT16925.1 hypothetical protein ATCV1_Z791L [Acanthocystis turfacea chlorella virus 1]
MFTCKLSSIDIRAKSAVVKLVGVFNNDGPRGRRLDVPTVDVSTNADGVRHIGVLGPQLLDKLLQLLKVLDHLPGELVGLGQVLLLGRIKLVEAEVAAAIARATITSGGMCVELILEHGNGIQGVVNVVPQVLAEGDEVIASHARQVAGGVVVGHGCFGSLGGFESCENSDCL